MFWFCKVDSWLCNLFVNKYVNRSNKIEYYCYFYFGNYSIGFVICMFM